MWASEIKSLLYQNGFGHVWVNEGFGDIEHFLTLYKQRFGIYFNTRMAFNITENRKLDSYILYNLEPLLETYFFINIMPKHRIFVSRFRCMNHNLSI